MTYLETQMTRDVRSVVYNRYIIQAFEYLARGEQPHRRNSWTKACSPRDMRLEASSS